jgi:hypothetical protein
MAPSKKKSKGKKAKAASATEEKSIKNEEEDALLEEAMRLAAAEEKERKAATLESTSSAEKKGGRKKKIVRTTPSELAECHEAMNAFAKDLTDAAAGNNFTSTATENYMISKGDMYNRSRGLPSTASMVQLMKNPMFRKLRDAHNFDVSSGNKQDPHEMSLERQLKELQLNDRGGSFAMTVEDQRDKFMHGWTPWLLDKETKKKCKQLCNHLLNAAVEASEYDVGDFIDKFAHGMQASQMKTMDVWGDMEKLEHIKRYFLSVGTQELCDGKDGEDVAVCAYFARFFEHYIQCYKERKPMMAAKTYELLFLDHRTIVSFFKNRIGCKCLETEYDKVKDMPKMAICSNSHCKLPKRRVERSKVLCCSKCFQRDYCSRKCQKADWNSHKKTCGQSKKLIEEEMKKYREQNKGSEGKSHHIVQVCL